jgi:predicted DNA-binding transcriptional regulator AlpA
MARPEITGRAIPRAAFSIDEFCRSHGFSRATFYNLIAAGEGPELLRVRNRVLITPGAAARWRKRHTAPARASVHSDQAI